MSEPVPRAITKEEARELFLQAIQSMCEYWAHTPAAANYSHQRRLEGFAHSALCIIDGVSGAMPCAINMALSPHPDDKQYCIEHGKNWFEDGMVINDDCHLHELLHRGGTL